MQRVIAARGEFAIHGDEFLHAADLRAEHDAIGGQAERNGAVGRIERGADERFAQHARGIPRLGARVVFVHQLRGERLVE